MTIPLTQGLFAFVDAEDYALLSQYKWHAKFSKGNWYAATRIKDQHIFMHNLLLGKNPGLEIDHKNQNGLDNHRANLRYATLSQNRANVSLRSDNKSGYKGVSYYKPRGNWRAYIQKDKKWQQIGYFSTKEEAAKAYNESAKELFGEFAWLNPL